MAYHPDLLAVPVPRYTSYPTAAEFHDGVGADEQARGLSAVGEHEPVSLYLHLPFCEKICFYCGCNTAAANRAARLEAYVARLEQEIDMVARRLDGRGRVVRVAFGGGSPNALSPAQFARLADRVTDALGGDRAAWSVEVDPRSLTPGFAEAMKRVRVTRASLGVQTFDEAIQARIGRVQPLEMIERATGLLRAAGVTSLNMDFMYGLPGQDTNGLLGGLEIAGALGADRLAVFGYAHVPHLVPRQRKIDDHALPGAEERFAMAAASRTLLVGAGYEAIGFDHFAKAADPMGKAARAGHVRRNFQGYTDDPCETLIGLGASSISRLPGALVQNDKNNGRYAMRVANGLLPATRGVALPPLERLRGRLIERLLCQGEARLDALPDRETILAGLAPFAERGLCTIAGQTVRIEDEGWPYARAMASRLDPWRSVSRTRFSSAV